MLGSLSFRAADVGSTATHISSQRRMYPELPWMQVLHNEYWVKRSESDQRSLFWALIKDFKDGNRLKFVYSSRDSCG